jgi:threonine/homoserine/homoserine lactone efflux protein
MTFSPGVNNITSMIYGSKYDREIVTNYIVGIFVGFFVVMLGTGVFSLLLEDSFPEFRSIITYICAIYLFVLGIHTLFTDSVPKGESFTASTRLLLVGTTLQIINPKVIFHGMIAMSIYILPYNSSFIAMLGFSLFLAALSFVSCTIWSYFGVLLKEFLIKNDTIYKLVVSALFIVSAYLMVV